MENQIKIDSKVKLLKDHDTYSAGSTGTVVDILDSKTFVIDLDGPEMKYLVVDNRWQDEIELV